jgi:hypothetical protein
MLNHNVVVLQATTSSTTCHLPLCRCHYSRGQLICVCIPAYVSEIFQPSISYAIQKNSHIITAANIYYFVFFTGRLHEFFSCNRCLHAGSTPHPPYILHNRNLTLYVLIKWLSYELHGTASAIADNYSAGQGTSYFFHRI